MKRDAQREKEEGHNESKSCLTVSAACALTFGVGQAFADTLIVDDDRDHAHRQLFTSIQPQ